MRRKGDGVQERFSLLYCTYGRGVLLIFLGIILASCREIPAEHELPPRTLQQKSQVPRGPTISPPDVNQCTHVELEYLPSTIDCTLSSDTDKDLLSPEELEFLQSLDKIVVTDKDCLKAFAHDVSLGSYLGQSRGGIGRYCGVRVTCYRGSERATSFELRAGALTTEDGHRFGYYEEGVPDIDSLTPQLEPFRIRVGCRHNLTNLFIRIPSDQNNTPVPPGTAEWCDFIVRSLRSRGIDEAAIMRPFRCPGVHEGRSTYALNPDCGRRSPGDTVLLFETRPGWNQRGGPELFTFDNHSPRGGCVLLKNATVKFIRTEEELKQLRWK